VLLILLTGVTKLCRYFNRFIRISSYRPDVNFSWPVSALSYNTFLSLSMDPQNRALCHRAFLDRYFLGKARARINIIVKVRIRYVYGQSLRFRVTVKIRVKIEVWYI